MLNRRHLRTKVLQSVYAFTQSGNTDLANGEKELLFSFEKIYDLFLYHLLSFTELRDQVNKSIEASRNKLLPTEADLNPNLKFVENPVLKLLAENPRINDIAKRRGINWDEERESLKKVIQQFKCSAKFTEYMDSSDTSFESHQDIVLKFYKKFFIESELIQHFFEEKSIYWIDDWELVCISVMKFVKSLSPDQEADFQIPVLFNDSEDKTFAIDLFRKTILNMDKFDSMISKAAQNWDIDRIALMDILIMKMALTELEFFPNVPVRVTLNEFIEISKNYSTPRSNIFINGVLDKLVDSLKNENRLQKTGKGLME